jgi:hypothetical protein
VKVPVEEKTKTFHSVCSFSPCPFESDSLIEMRDHLIEKGYFASAREFQERSLGWFTDELKTDDRGKYFSWRDRDERELFKSYLWE